MAFCGIDITGLVPDDVPNNASSSSGDWGNGVVQWNNADGTVQYSIDGVVIDGPGNVPISYYVVSSGVTVDTINTSSGSTSEIYNSGTINTIQAGSNSNSIINNSGSIGKILVAFDSYAEINNRGRITGTINVGFFSATDINNSGYINEIHIDENSYGTIDNHGTIKTVSVSGDSAAIVNNDEGGILESVYSSDSIVSISGEVGLYKESNSTSKFELSLLSTAQKTSESASKLLWELRNKITSIKRDLKRNQKFGTR